MSLRRPRTVFDWKRREHRSARIAGLVLILVGVLMAAGAWVGVAGDLESGETTVHQRRLGSRVVLRADDPAGFHARVLGSGLLVFAFGAAFVVFGRSLLNEREPVQRGFDAKWELDNAVRRPLDPSA